MSLLIWSCLNFFIGYMRKAGLIEYEVCGLKFMMWYHWKLLKKNAVTIQYLLDNLEFYDHHVSNDCKVLYHWLQDPPNLNYFYDKYMPEIKQKMTSKILIQIFPFTYSKGNKNQ